MSASSIRRLPGVAAVAVALAVALTASPAHAFGDRQPPTAPTNLRVVSSTLTSVTLAWSPSTDNRGVRSYTVNRAGGLGTTQVFSPQTTATVTSLSPGQTYEFSVRAWDAASNGSAPATITASTQPDTQVPTTPGNLTLIGVAGSTVTLRWSPSTDNDPLTYDVLVDGVPTPNAMSTIPPGSYPPSLYGAIVRDLEPGTTYTFAVRARDGSGNVSPPSNAVTATTEPSSDAVAPSTPTLLQAWNGGSSVCPEEIWMRWTPSTDDVDPTVEYEVRINGVINDVVTWTNHITYTDVRGINNVTIVAVDSAGNTSAPSNMIPVGIDWGIDCPS